jgi:hypothetical protein
VNKHPILISALCLAISFFSSIENLLTAREIGSEANLCAEINSLQPGEILTLMPGDYRGPCKIRRGGTAGSPIVIRGQSIIEKPRIVYEGQDSNVFEIIADYVTLRSLKIGPTKRNVAGVRILARAGITVEDCEFSQLGGIAIAATRTSVDGLYVRRNIVIDSSATAMYFGCHDGMECQISNLSVERNFIRGVDAVEPEIGYGIQLKLNTTGVISDNVIADTKGPGIMVYGSSDQNRPSLIERNFISGSRQSSGVLVGGGPARVRNNIVSRNFQGGITLQDYADRGLLRKISVLNNTSFKNDFGEFVVPLQATLSEVLFASNAAVTSDGAQAFPRRQTGLELRQNIDCTTRVCFTDPLSLNFSPIPASPLAHVANLGDAALPLDDYYGRSRNGRLTAGAVAFAAPPIRLGIKSEH